MSTITNPPEARWLTGVVTFGGDRQAAMLLMQPGTAEVFDQAATRVRRVGFSRLGRVTYVQGRWPLSATTYIDVVDQTVVRFTTGQTSFYAGRRNLTTTPLWRSCALEARALIAVAPPGTIPEQLPDGGLDPKELVDLINPLRLLCATAGVRFDVFTDPIPAPR